ncbi:MAG: hypothetical protein WAK53_17690 [Chromatiaceae bacterium]
MARKNKTLSSNSRLSLPKPFIALPQFLFQRSPDFDDRAPLDVMSEAARRTLYFLLSQYQGRNNGDLAIAPKTCEKYGIPRSIARRGITELAYHGLVVETRRGSLNRTSLFGVTWLGLDEEVSHKFDEGVEPSPVPLQSWTLQYRRTRTAHLVKEHEDFLTRRAGGRWRKDEAPSLPSPSVPSNRRRRSKRTSMAI